MSIARRKLKDGSTVYDATLEYGRVGGKRVREYRTFATLREARAAEADAKRCRDGLAHHGGLKLAEYVERVYWPIASRRLAATSLDTYEKEIRLRILPSLGEMRLEDIDRRAVQAMVDSCATEPVARKALGTLKTILNEAVSDGYITANPALLKYALPKGGARRDNGLILPNFGQVASFVAVVQNDAQEAVVRLVMAGLMLGLRPEERYALDWEDLDPVDMTVHVHAAYVTASRVHGGVHMKRAKTANSDRVIPMPQAFADWLRTVPRGRGAWIVGRDGTRLSPSTGRKMWTRYLDAHPNLPRITLENMRHSFATSCLAAGMHVEDVSRMLGHADIGTTFRRYVKPDLANMRLGVALIPSVGRRGVPPGQRRSRPEFDSPRLHQQL